jgi:transposase
VRADGARSALRVLLAARDLINRQRVANINALTALVRCSDLGYDARRALKPAQVKHIAAWRRHPSDRIDQAAARAEAARLAKAITAADTELKDNKQQIAALVEQLTPGMADQPGYGPVTCAGLITAYSHHGRIRSEAAFAAMAGANPLEASSGNTTRHRLNRHGDRRLNLALDTIAKSRLRFDPETVAYLDKRTRQGLSYREAKRCVKRYLARSAYRQLTKYPTLTA